MAEINLGHVVGPAGPGVPAGGATGKVLIKKSGADYDTEWGDAGTSDALPLAGGTMSGAINMDGNKVSNLPAPTASGDAVPKGYADGLLTGYRTAAAQDAIDANLMALGLTGASAGDLVRINTVDANGKPTSWRKAPLCEVKTNPNLLDNWYFVGGGSQQGGEQFPINQRGQTVYSSSGYTIDRWERFVGGQIIIDSDGLRFSSGELQWSQLRQPIETSSIHGQTVTFSVLFSTVSNPIYLYAMNGDSVDIMVGPEITSAGLHSITFVVPSTESKLYLAFQQRTNSGQNVERCKIKACKLELGSEQTLAHLENGVWVLNEIPNYEDQLLKCQTSKADSTDTFANGTVSALRINGTIAFEANCPDNSESYVMKYGQLVNLNISTDQLSINAGGWHKIGTLPEGYRPVRYSSYRACDYSHDIIAYVDILTNGDVRALITQQTARYRANVMFFTN